MDPQSLEQVRKAVRRGAPGSKGPGPGGRNMPAGAGGAFNPPQGFGADPMGDLPEGMGMPAPPTPPPPMDPPLTSQDFASMAGPSLYLYAVLTFIPTLLVFQLIYNFFLRDEYFGGFNFYKLLYLALTGQLAKRMGLGEARALADEAAKRGDQKGVPVGKNGKPLTAQEEYSNVMLKAKLVSAVLRSRRHEFHGLTDDEYLKACTAEATSLATGGKITGKKNGPTEGPNPNSKNRVKTSSGMLNFLDEEEAAVRAHPTAEVNVKYENLAIFIGVNTDETPLALEDAEKLCNRMFKDPHRPTGSSGTYRPCVFGSQGSASTAGNDASVASHQKVIVRPTSANLMALVADIATCRVRQWNNIVVYVAAPMRAAPVSWLDDALVRDETTNYLGLRNFCRTDLVTTITEKDDHYVRNCFADPPAQAAGGKTPAVANKDPSLFPKFTIEFLADASEPTNELSWVDLSLFITRLREAVLESGQLQEAASLVQKGQVTAANNLTAAKFRTTSANFVVMLDAAYRPEAVKDSVHYITNKEEGFYCDPTVGLSDVDKKNRAASEAKLNPVQQNALKLTISVEEKALFQPPQELINTLSQLSLHEAVAYGLLAPLTPFTNLSIFVTPRRNYFVEKAVRQGLQKAAWALLDGKEIPIKTPAMALDALMASTPAAMSRATAVGGLSGPSPNNPKLVGFSDFVRCLMEGYFAAMSADGKVPTADVALDKLSDPSAALIAPGIRGSCDGSAFWCGRMTVASAALYLNRHAQMVGFSDVVLPSADGDTSGSPTASAMSVASTASPGARVPTTSTPMLALFTRGLSLDATFFTQMSLAPRGAPSTVSPPLMLMPSQRYLRQCEELVVPAVRGVAENGSPFYAFEAEREEEGSSAASDLNPVAQSMGWNGELLRHFTDGIHLFSVPTIVPSLADGTAARIAKGLGTTTEEYTDLLAQHSIMRMASALLEHSSHSHLGSVATFSEAVRVLSIIAERGVLAIVFLQVPTADKDGSLSVQVWQRVLAYLGDIFQQATPKANGEARITIILVPSAVGKGPVLLPSGLQATTIALPNQSVLDIRSSFRAKWVMPSAAAILSTCSQLHNNYSNTFADDGSPSAPITRQEIERIVHSTAPHANSSVPLIALEEAAKALIPSSQSNITTALYQAHPEALVAPLLRYLLISGACPLEGIKDSSSLVSAVGKGLIEGGGKLRRIAPTTDQAAVKLAIQAIVRAHGSSSSSLVGATGVDGIVRIPTSILFAIFDDLVQATNASGKIQFARTWTLFYDTIALLGYSGLLLSHTTANGAPASLLYSPYICSAVATSAVEAAASLKSDDIPDARSCATLFEDLQAFVEVNPLVDVAALGKLLSGEHKQTATIADTFRALSFRPLKQGDSRALFATLAGYKMRFTQTALWTRYLAGSESALNLLEAPTATAADKASALPIICFDLLDTITVSTLSQLVVPMHALLLVRRALAILEGLNSTIEAAIDGTTLKAVDVIDARRRAKGFVAVCEQFIFATAEDGQARIAAVLPPSANEWWVQLCHTSELLDANVGRPITAEHDAKAAVKGKATPAMDEYKFEDDAAERPAAGAASNSADPRLRDYSCPIATVQTARPSSAVSTTPEELRAIISQEKAPRAQYMQLFEREDIVGDEPSAIEELDSDADEDDVAELHARLASQEVRRKAAVEANKLGVLLSTDLAISENGKCYYRGARDAVLLVSADGSAAFPWGKGGAKAAPSPFSAAVSCLSYTDGKLFVGHTDGSLTVCEADTTKVLSHVDGSAHQGAPVTDITPYARNHADIGNHNFYLSYASGIKVHGDDGTHANPKASTSIVTASKANRCIQLWPTNVLDASDLKAGKVQQLKVLDSSKAVRLKDPMSRCFFARIARRGVDEVQLRQNIGNPEELTARRSISALIKTPNNGRKAPAGDEEDPDDIAISHAVAPILAKGKAVPSANDTVLVMYGSSVQGTQHDADGQFNSNAFVGTDGIWQHALSLTVPLGFEVTAVTVGPGPKGEARLAVAVSSLTTKEQHYIQQFAILRSQ